MIPLREFRSLRSQNRAQKKKNVEGINSGLGPWIQKPGWTKDLKLLKREGGPRQMQNYI